MSKVSRPWKIAAGAFVLINAAGAPLAFAMGEPLHGSAHIAALVLGFLGWQVFVKREDDVQPVSEIPAEQRLDSLQNAVDSIALNVERIGEAQRFQERLVRERAAERQPPEGEG